jgi:hypothetical protein
MLNRKYRETDLNNTEYETACSTIKEKVRHSAVDFYDEVENLKGMQPFDKKSEAYDKWKLMVNKKIAYFNGIIGWRCYKLV